jgi:hypothetical protein
MDELARPGKIPLMELLIAPRAGDIATQPPLLPHGSLENASGEGRIAQAARSPVQTRRRPKCRLVLLSKQEPIGILWTGVAT